MTYLPKVAINEERDLFGPIENNSYFTITPYITVVHSVVFTQKLIECL